jgi:hypothetical protein
MTQLFLSVNLFLEGFDPFVDLILAVLKEFLAAATKVIGYTALARAAVLIAVGSGIHLPIAFPTLGCGPSVVDTRLHFVILVVESVQRRFLYSRLKIR